MDFGNFLHYLMSIWIRTHNKGYNMKKNAGVTFLELMVVVMIIAILAVVSMGVYLNYTARAKVAEGLGLADAVKLAVAETQQTSGSFPTSNVTAGVQATLSSTYVDSVSVGTAGVITIAYKNSELGISSSGVSTIQMEPSAINGSVYWQCQGGSLANKYRPPICR